MKRLTLLIISCLCTFNVIAQECSLCGTWIGNYKAQEFDESLGELVYKTFKIFVRINRNEYNYHVRIKSYDIKNTSDLRYWDECNIVEADDNNISWYRHTERKPFYVNGHIDCYIEGKLYDCIKNVGGALQLKILYRHVVTTYNRQGKYVEEEDRLFTPIKVMLYKEESDW